MRIPQGYKLLVIGPEGVSLGEVSLEGCDFTRQASAVKLADEISNVILARYRRKMAEQGVGR